MRTDFQRRGGTGTGRPRPLVLMVPRRGRGSSGARRAPRGGETKRRGSETKRREGGGRHKKRAGRGRGWGMAGIRGGTRGRASGGWHGFGLRTYGVRD